MKRLLSLLLAASMFLSLPVYSHAEDGTELLSEAPAEEQTDIIPEEEEPEEAPVHDVLTEEEVLEKDALYAENVELRAQSADAPMLMNAGTADSGTFGDGLTWSFVNNTLTISGEGAIPEIRYNTYPWYSYRNQVYTISIGKDITYIPLDVLERCHALNTILVEEGNLAYTVSDNVLFDREMRRLVFYPGSLDAETYTIPSTVTEIGEGSLADASRLTALTIPASVISIPENSLPYYGELMSVTVESGSQVYCSVDGVLYDRNQSLLMLYPTQKPDTSFEIPETVTQLWNNSFENNEHLTAVTVPAAVSELGYHPFSGCSSLTSITVHEDNQTFASENGILYTKQMDTLLCYPPAKEGTAYSVPATVKLLENYSIQNAENLTVVNIPASVEMIELYAIRYCPALTAINVDSGNKAYMSEDGILYDIHKSNLLNYPGAKTTADFTVPNGVETISSTAFYEVSALRTLTIPGTVTTICSDAVFRCENLTDVYINGSPVFENNAFDTDNDFTLHGMTGSRVELYAEKYGISFESTGLYTASVVAEGTLTDTISWTLDSLGVLTLTGTGELPDSCGELTAFVSSVRVIRIGDGITVIPENFFWECRNVEEITLPASVTSIADDAFYRDNIIVNAPNGSLAELYANVYGFKFVCTGGEDTEVVYRTGRHGDNITWTLYDSGKMVLSGTGEMAEIEDYDGAPWYDLMQYVESFVIEDGITSIVRYTANAMYNFTSVKIPASVAVIEENAFYTYREDAVFYGSDGSEAEIFAKARGFTFIADTEDKLNVYAEGTYGNITWVLYDSAELVLSGTGVVGSLTSYQRDQPWVESYSYRVRTVTVNEGITGLGIYCFDDMRLITAVSLPSTLTGIGNYAFDSCRELVTITIPAAVTTIGERAFYSCYALTGIYVEDDNTAFVSDGGILFNSAKTELIAYPAGRPNTAYVIPEGITSLGIGAFSGSNVHTITIPVSMTEIEYSELSTMARIIVSEGNTEYSSDDYGVLYNKEKTILYVYPRNAEYTEFTVPAAVTEIAERAFQNCYELKVIVVHASVTEFGYDAFNKNQNYTVHCWDNTEAERFVKANNISCYIVDGDKVNVLGSGTTGSLSWSLTDDGVLSITGTGAMPDYYSSNSPWDDLKEIVKTVVISEGVTSIGNYAFYECENLTALTLPSTLTSIGHYAFRYCYALETFEIPVSVTSIGTSVFANCNNLTLTVNAANTAFVMDSCVLFNADKTVLYAYIGSADVTEYSIPETVTEIKSNAFQSCGDRIETLYVPESVTSVGEYAFSSLYYLTDAYIYAREATYGSSAFSNYSDLTLHVNDGTTAEYYAKSLSNVTVVVMDGDKANVIADGSCGENVVWTFDDTGVLKISGTGAMKNYTSSENVPWISYSRSNVKSIVIEDGVTAIGDYAFYDCRLATSAVIADSVTSIGIYAFYDTYQLTDLKLSANLLSIGDYAFAYCNGLTEIDLPDTLTSIGEYAFVNSYRLTSVEIPANVTAIGKAAFLYCSALTTLTAAEGNTAFCTENNVLYSADKTVLYCYPGGKTDSSFTIPGTVSTIRFRAICENDSLTALVIPESVKTVEEYAVSSLENLTDLTIYTKDAVLANYAISVYTEGFAITAYDGSTAEFYAKKRGYTFNPIGGVDNPNTMDSGDCGEAVTWALWDDGRLVISGTGAMADYTNSSNTPWYSKYSGDIKSIVVEEGVTHIGNYAFAYLDTCTVVSIANTVETIGSHAFYDDDGLMEIVLPDSLITIGDYAFYYNSHVKTISIGSGLESFGQYTFGNLYALTEIIVEDGNTAYSSEDGVLFNADKTVLILYPPAKADTAYTVPSTVTTLSTYAFYYVNYLTSLTLPASLTAVESQAVYYGSYLKNIIIDSMNAAFVSDSIYVSSNVTFTVHDGSTAEVYAKEKNYTIQYFEGETDTAGTVAEGTCGENLTWKLDDNGQLVISGEGDMENYSSYSAVPWYSYKNKIKTVVVEDGVTSIGDRAFYDYDYYLTSVTLADSITSIGNYAFYYCDEVDTITLPANLVSIGEYAFRYCRKLTSVTIPASVTSIGKQAFESTYALTEIIVENGNIAYSSEDGVLFNADKTTLILYPCAKADTAYTVPATVTTLSKYAFYQVQYLTSLTLPASLTAVESQAVYYGSNLKNIIIDSMNAAFVSDSIYVSSSNVTFTVHDGSTAEVYAKEKNYMIQYFEGETDTAGTVAEGTCGENLTWKLDENGLVVISGTGAMSDYSSASAAPWYSYKSKIKTVVVEDGVTSIGKYAFYYYDNYLTSITLADSITAIGDRAFYYCDEVDTITLPANLVSIGEYAFRYCRKLTSVTIPASVTSIGKQAFESTYALTEVIVENGNTAYSSEDGVLFNADKTTLILYPYAKADTEYTVPSTVTTLSTYAFDDVNYLTSLTLPATLTTVESQAVCYGSILMNIIIDSMNAAFVSDSIYVSSSNVTFTVHDGSTAEVYAKEKGFTIQYFEGETDTASTIAEGTCGENLTWKLDENGLFVISGEGDMEDYSSSGSSAAPWYSYRSKIKTIVVEEGITSIGSYAFYDCDNGLTSITLADSITSIGNYAFYYCDDVTTINIPANLVTIGSYAFYCMNDITGFDLPDTLETIGSHAFNSCSGMKSVRIPAAVTSIGDRAFTSCSALERIVVDADNTVYSSEDGVLYDKDKTILYNYPAKSAFTSYEIPDTVTEINSYAFYSAANLETVTIPEDVTSVGQYNFYSCGKLTSATVYAREATFGYNVLRYNASGFTVYGYAGSTVETHCGNNSVTFSALPEEEGEDDLTVTFKVVDSTSDTLDPINGAMVYVFNEDGSVDRRRTTGTSGVITMELEDGTYTVQAYKNGYELRTITIEVAEGHREYTLALSSESILQVTTTVTELTRDEAISAGVNVSADENRHIYKCTAVLDFIPIDDYTYYCAGDEIIEAEPIRYNGITVQPVARDVFLLVYSEVAWLKEMFKVELVAANTSAFEVIEDSEAVIDLPDGVSLAVMTDEVGQQSTKVDLGDIAPKSSANHIWYIVGDEKGEYYINGIVNGTRVGGGISEDIAVGFTTKTPITVLAGDAMKLTITAEKYATVGEPYRMLYRLDNVSEKTLYDVSLNVLGGRFAKDYDVTDLEYIPEVEGGPELSGEFAHGYTISDTEFTPGEYISGVFKITFGTGIETDAVEYMLKDFFTVTGKGSTTEIPTEINLVDSLDPCVWIREIIKEPTCTEEGLANLTCTNCTINKTEPIPALGHDFELTRTVDKEATCTEEGSASYHCTRCDATRGSITLPALKHDYVWTYDVEPTCEEGGHGTGVCSRCGDVIESDVEALGHEWSDWTTTKEPDCENNGSKERTCSRCGSTEIETIPALGHDWPADWTYDPAAGCETAGYRHRTCQRCQKFEEENLDPLQHEWTEWVEDPVPVCEVAGKKTRTCLRCGKTEEVELPALEHEWTEWVIVEPTCTEDGTETRTCTLCGKDEVVVNDKLGHDWDDGVCIKYPTLTETGIMLFTCQRENCGATREDTIPVAEEQDAGYFPGLFPNYEKIVTYVYGEEYSVYFVPYNSSIDDPVTTFLSSNEEVATVDEYGEVFLKGVGEAEISVHYEKYVYYDKKTQTYESYVEAIDSFRIIITPASLTVTVDDSELFYGEDPAELDFTYTCEGFVFFEDDDGVIFYQEDESVLEGTMTYSCGYKQYDTVGDYEIVGSGLTARNYDITFVPGTLTVNKAKEHTITLGALTQTRGQTTGVTTEITPQDSSAVITVEYNTDGTWTSVMPTDAGEYPVRASLTSSDNIEVSGKYFTDTLTIEKTPLTITVDDTSIFYGSEWDASEATFTAEGYILDEDDSVLGGTLTCTTEYVRYSPAGTYSITGSGLTAKNYDITFEPGTLTVNKAESHTITLGNLQQKRGELAPVTAEIEPQDETAVITVEYEHSDGTWSAEMPVSSGEYNVRASLTESTNIEVTGEYFTEVLTIEKAVLTVTVSDLTLFYGDEWTEDLCGVTAEGLLDGDDMSVLEGMMTYTCDYEQYGEPGTYVIVGSGLTSVNYDITFVPGTLTVNKAKEHTITLGNLTQRRGETSPVTTVIAPQDDSAVITVEYQHEDGVWSTELPDAVGEFNVRASLASSDRIEATGDFFTEVLTIKAGASIGGENQNTGVELIVTDTTVEVVVPDETLDEIIENVPESGELVISVLNTEGAAETKELILPGNLMQTVAENEAVTDVTITADNTEITMNSKVLNKISSEIDAVREKTEGETTEKINLSIDDVPEEKMTEEQKKAVEKMGNNPVLLELTLTVTSYNEDDEVVAEEKLHKLGGKVKVRAAYDLGEDMEGARIVVCYVDDKGTPSYVPATYSDGYVEFTTDHFSFFLICTTEKPLLIGDVNDDGEVDEEDLPLLAAYFAGVPDAESAILNAEAADINRNQILDRADQMILARYLAGWPDVQKYFSEKND